jgi:hypothetical protein
MKRNTKIAIAVTLIALSIGTDIGRAQSPITAKEAGARYGQALGAIEICIGSKLTAKAEELKSTYSDANAETFTTEAAKVFQAWAAVKNCNRAKDPNQCKIIMDKSCASAFSEIGPTGTAYPGLLEPPKNERGTASQSP